MRKIILALLVLVLPLQGCSLRDRQTDPARPEPAPILTESPVPESAPATFNPAKLGTVETDVTYCTMDGVDLKMDIYYPAEDSGPWPVAMYVHGGGWVGGDKGGGAGAKDIPALVDAGFLTVSVNYRLAPKHTFPAMIEDVKCAVRSLRAHAETYHIDPQRIGAWGGSAGGHLVSLLGTTDGSEGWDVGEYLDQSSRVQAVVDMFGPADLTAEDFTSMQRENKPTIVFGVVSGAPLMVEASPISHVSAEDPPFLILQGTQDDVVPVSQSQNFYQALQAAGVPAELVLVENANHGFAPDGGLPDPTRDEITQMVVKFFTTKLMMN